MLYLQLTGRCANGAERDAGKLWHLVDTEYMYPNFATALCGAKPGRLSNGWAEHMGTGMERNVCPRCLKKFHVPGGA